MLAEKRAYRGQPYRTIIPDMSKITGQGCLSKGVERFETLFREQTGQEMSKFYRPPQGVYSESNLQMAHELGYTTVFWSLAYADWLQDEQPTREQAFQKLLPRTQRRRRAVARTSQTNADILDELLTKWEEMGYRFALTELQEQLRHRLQPLHRPPLNGNLDAPRMRGVFCLLPLTNALSLTIIMGICTKYVRRCPHAAQSQMPPRMCRTAVPDVLPQSGGCEVLPLSVEQLEALRLCDLEGLDQDSAALRMDVSRGTFQRILYAALQVRGDRAGRWQGAFHRRWPLRGGTHP